MQYEILGLRLLFTPSAKLNLLSLLGERCTVKSDVVTWFTTDVHGHYRDHVEMLAR